jgi:hypothetical protein
MAERSMPRPGGGLGGNQIRWLRTNMKPFDDAWKAVQASDAHARKIKSQLQPDLTRLESELDASGGPLQRLRLVERRSRRRGPVSA